MTEANLSVDTGE